jgi:hypothetical protein
MAKKENISKFNVLCMSIWENYTCRKEEKEGQYCFIIAFFQSIHKKIFMLKNVIFPLAEVHLLMRFFKGHPEDEKRKKKNI